MIQSITTDSALNGIAASAANGAQPAAVQTTFHGLALADIANAWLMATGGMPAEGEAVARLYKLATRMRYITNFRSDVVAAAIPHCGLSDQEIVRICIDACNANKSADLPQDMQQVLDQMLAEQYRKQSAETAPEADAEAADEESDAEPVIELCETDRTPSLPPIFKQCHDNVPEFFKQYVVLALLPILGTLASKLRAKYDGVVQSPTFMVAVSGKQSSGKSFVGRLVDLLLGGMKARELPLREMEQQKSENRRVKKATGVKSNGGGIAEEDSVDHHVIRMLPPVNSGTKLLMRLANAQGLHCFTYAAEISTVQKSFGKCGNIADLLCNAYDNTSYGQDYASDDSFSGEIPHVYYNTIYTGTPNSIKKFYAPHVEGGLVSRTLFINMKKVIGMEKPHWKEMTEKQLAEIRYQAERLNSISVEGDQVKSEMELDMPWLSSFMVSWENQQKRKAALDNSESRDTYASRCASDGFRAGMLAWYLWGLKDTPYIRRKVCQFAQWVANCKLKAVMTLFPLEEQTTESFRFQKVYNQLGATFNRQQLQAAMDGLGTADSVVISDWKKLGLITADKPYGAQLFTKVRG